jgi:hypothetical protein
MKDVMKERQDSWRVEEDRNRNCSEAGKGQEDRR